MGERIGVDEFGEPTYANETISPQRAAEIYESYVRNRSIRKVKVNQYGRAMDGSAGKWWMNGEGLIFDWNGVPINGAHRCLASMESGCSFRTLVVRGVDPEAFQAIDSGAVRQFGDDLAIQGVSNAKSAAGLLRKIACWNFNKARDAESRGVETEKGNGGLAGLHSFTISRAELHEMWPVYAKEIVDAMTTTAKWYNDFKGDGGALLFVYWLLTREENNPELVERYFNILCYGSEDKVGNNVLIKLREVLGGKVSADRALRMKNHRQEFHVYWMLQNWSRWVRMGRLPSFTVRGAEGMVTNPFPQPQRVR